jgi:hypothetical protein
MPSIASSVRNSRGGQSMGSAYRRCVRTHVRILERSSVNKGEGCSRRYELSEEASEREWSGRVLFLLTSFFSGTSCTAHQNIDQSIAKGAVAPEFPIHHEDIEPLPLAASLPDPCCVPTCLPCFYHPDCPRTLHKPSLCPVLRP